MGIRYIKRSQMNHPHRLSNKDLHRVSDALKEDYVLESVSMYEMEAYHDYLYNIMVYQSQTHLGSLVIQ